MQILEGGGLTLGGVLNVHVKAVHFNSLPPVVKRAWYALGNHGLIARAEHIPELVRQEVGLLDASQLIGQDATAQGKNDFLAVGLLAGWDLGAETGAVRKQGIPLRRVDTSKARAVKDGTAALVAEVGSEKAIGLSRKEVNEGQDDDIHVRLRAVVDQVELIGALTLDVVRVSDAGVRHGF